MKTVLCIGAHPDDIEIGCGGTVAKLIDQGAAAYAICVTSGDAGSQHVPSADLAKTREDETKRGLATLGIHNVIFLGAKDGLVALTYDLKIELIRCIRQIRPDTIFTHARADSAPDHQLVATLTDMATRAAAGPWFQEVPEPPHLVENIYGYEVWSPIANHQLAVCIDATMQRKLAAIQCHTSQLQGVGYDRAVEGLAAYRGVMTMVGSFAEVFEVWRQGLTAC